METTTNREIRSIPEEDSEVRALSNSRSIEGYGIVFNKESRDLGGFTELILPSAMDGIIRKCDIVALLNHDISRGVLARSTNGSGSLRLLVDTKGVKYGFEAPNFDLGNELVEGVRRGDIKASSFSFSVNRNGERMERRRDGSYLRTISQFDQVLDMSPCYREAYQDTTVALRNLDEFKSANDGLTDDIIPEPVIADTIIEPTEKVEEVKVVRSERELELRNEHNNLKIKNL